MMSAWHDQLLADARAAAGASRVQLDPVSGFTLPANDFTVLRIAGMQSERTLPFAALHRLLLPVLSADDLRGMLRGTPFQLRMAVHELLTTLAVQQPVLVQIDDAHWLDRETLDVMGFTARRTSGHRLAVLLTGRPEWTGDQPADLVALAADLPGSVVDAAQYAWHAGRPDWARTLLTSRSGVDVGRSALLLGEIELRDGDPAVAAHELTTAAEHLADPGLALLLAGEARRLCGDMPGYRALARAVPAQPSLMAAHFRGLTATYAGQHEQAHEPLRQVVRLGMDASDVASAVWAAEGAFALGMGEKAYECASAAVYRARLTGREAALPWALVQLSLAAIVLDRHEVAIEASTEGLAASGAQRTTHTEHLSLLALSAALRDDRAAARSYLDRSAAGIGKRGLGRPCAITSWAYACLDLADDRPGDALARLDAMTAGVSGAQPAIQVLATPQLVEAAVLVGQTERAERALQVFDAWVRMGGNSAWLALSHRCHGLLTDNMIHFESAITLHRKAGAAMELARTQMVYAHRLRLQRRLLDARVQFRAALRVFESIGAKTWADRAQAGLRAAGETVGAQNASLAGLTPQQAAISRLVAVGETNKEIARRLVISHRTVDHHLRNIFTALGVRSRVELARRVTSLDTDPA
jgi:DNA-binding CsgD family transcriptional regulator